MKLYSSAYCAWPDDAEGREEFVTELAKKDWFGGLEIPFIDELVWPAGAPADTPTIVTGIPGTTFYNAKYPSFGLASPDKAGRIAAIDWARMEAKGVAKLVSEGHQIRAVQIHPAPTAAAQKDMFKASMLELVEFDWGGAELWIEHSDAFVEGQKPNKGYLPIEDEIEVVSELAAEFPEHRFGMVINWARSAIEGRSAQTPLDHVHACQEAGLLRHFGFSSCSGVETAFGEPWFDGHLPFAETSVAPEGSLLGTAEAKAIFEATPGLTYGLKIGLRPLDMPVADRVAALDELAAFLDSAKES